MSFLWHADASTDLIYKINPSTGAVISSFAAPAAAPVGLAVDANGDLWHCDPSTDLIYRLNPSTGTVISSFATPAADGYGLAFDANGDLWHCDPGTDLIYKINPSTGAVISSFAAPGGAPRDVAVDTNGDVWVYDPGTDLIYRLNPSTGTVISSFATPAADGYGLAFDANGDLWHCDAATDLIYRLNPSTGTVISSFAAPGGIPTGLSWAETVHNLAPLAPTPTSPVDNAVLNVATSHTFEWDFEDPNSWDSQTAYDLRYRESGTSTWTTLSDTSTVESRTISGGTFTAGLTYEWQVRTYDTESVVGPWSASEFFNAAAQPSAPTIDAPTVGEVIGSEDYTVAWTTATQNAYQLRVVDDTAGAPDTGTVIFDTGTVEQASTRTRSVNFPTNLVTRHVQIRVRKDGLWSDWASVRVTVDYTQPATPTVDLTAIIDGSPHVLVGATHPAPSGSEPTVTSMDVHRRVTAEGGDGIRIAAGLGPTDTFEDHTVASGVDYEYSVRAYGDNNTSIYSAWTGAATAASSYYGGGYA